MRTTAAVLFAFAVMATGCGESATGNGGAGGTAGSGGSASGAGGSEGTDDCNRICENPCVEDVLPAGTVDDCLRACRMGSFTCIPETIAVLECLETISCGSIASPACLPQSEAFTTCLSGR